MGIRLRLPTIVCGILLLSGLTGGCVTKTLVIRSEPEGAETYLDGKHVGKTPVEMKFKHYGTRRVRVELPGWQTVNKKIHVVRPWYQTFPLDIISELLIPARIDDRKEFTFDLSKPVSDKDALLMRANRQRAQVLGGETEIVQPDAP